MRVKGRNAVCAVTPESQALTGACAGTALQNMNSSKTKNVRKALSPAELQFQVSQPRLQSNEAALSGQPRSILLQLIC
jgi:hypothetical protein